MVRRMVKQPSVQSVQVYEYSPTETKNRSALEKAVAAYSLSSTVEAILSVVDEISERRFSEELAVGGQRYKFLDGDHT